LMGSWILAPNEADVGNSRPSWTKTLLPQGNADG
jgi:hypothetical protein